MTSERQRELIRRWGRRPLQIFSVLVALGVGCSEDDVEPAAECLGGDGAVSGPTDTHCTEDDGTAIVRAIGACSGAGEAAEAEEEHEDGKHEEEEQYPVRTGREADDDLCKYRVSFENTCVALNEPVTFTLSLTRKMDGMPGTGGEAGFPEVYFADEVTHISPSANITANETSTGTYDIGPVVFDRSGRWVIRFHYFTMCSELPEDSPHSHVAFYIDVP